MNAVRKKRLYIVLAILVGVSVAVGLALSALQENINLFYTPTQIANGEAPKDTRIRAGGMVAKGSVKRSADSLDVEFVVTDFAKNVTIRYRGILPDLFREEQGIVALGLKLHAGLRVRLCSQTRCTEIDGEAHDSAPVCMSGNTPRTRIVSWKAIAAQPMTPARSPSGA